jgi:hypothetical protein
MRETKSAPAAGPVESDAVPAGVVDLGVARVQKASIGGACPMKPALRSSAWSASTAALESSARSRSTCGLASLPGGTKNPTRPARLDQGANSTTTAFPTTRPLGVVSLSRRGWNVTRRPRRLFGERGTESTSAGPSGAVA